MYTAASAERGKLKTPQRILYSVLPIEGWMDGRLRCRYSSLMCNLKMSKKNHID